jgi:hypothetical protein
MYEKEATKVRRGAAGEGGCKKKLPMVSVVVLERSDVCFHRRL